MPLVIITDVLLFYWLRWTFFCAFFRLHNAENATKKTMIVCISLGPLCHWPHASPLPPPSLIFTLIPNLMKDCLQVLWIKVCYELDGFFNWNSRIGPLYASKFTKPNFHKIRRESPKMLALVLCPLKTSGGVYRNALYSFLFMFRKGLIPLIS